MYQGLKHQDRVVGRLSPISLLTGTLRSRLITAADGVIDKYRNSSNPQIADFDWEKARLILATALR